MSEKWSKTISTKIPEDLMGEFEAVLMSNGHTKQLVLRVAVLEYIKRYTDSAEFRNYAENIQFE